MGQIYSLFYRVLINLLVPVVLVRFLVRGVTRREYWQRLTERFGYLPSPLIPGSIWIHAVSVGEVNAVRPLVEYLLENSDVPVLLSCVTPTGSAQITRLFGSRVSQVYAPVDSGIIVNRALERVKPCAIIIAETELWPNFLRVSGVRKIPVAFVNLRLSDTTFSRARFFLPLCRYALKSVSAFCVQTQVDAELITVLGANSDLVHVTGNLKFDMKAPDGIQETGVALREHWGGTGRPTVVLGSSHEGEESRFLQLMIELRVDFPELVAVIVPRHPERFNRVFRQISDCGFSVSRVSEWHSDAKVNADVILADTMGKLLEFYAASDIAVVGGSFAAVGGHNVLEPILVGTPVVFGPDMSNFREISKLVLESGAGERVDDFAALKPVLSRLLQDSDLRELRVGDGSRLLETNRGALQRTTDHLEGLLKLNSALE
ncbi:MAG: 3-deoxy-D-manno-octulosonic acid transferase [Proteobacteria bacterium]|nr:3-deoxy-D-manno-octulosonic acid transferase [Pseudomonadota bacterium]